MSASAGGSWLERRSSSLVLCVIVLAVFATTNLPWQLEDYDQAKQAFTSLEMVQQGHWLFQHTPNGWVATKPPLIGWISALTFFVTRSWDFAWRFPSIMAALALAYLIRRGATRAYGSAAGLLAVAAFGLNLFAPRLATLARTDMPLALIIFLIGAHIWEKIRTREPWTTRDRLVAFALLTASMLIKGPIVYAFLLPGIVAYALFVRRRGEEQVSAWCGAWPWLASLLVFALWVLVGIRTVPDFLEHVVIREFAGRFEGTHRAQPFYFYLPHLLHRFAPWSILVIFFAALARRTERLSPATLWLLCWSVGGIFLMSIIPSKRVDRIFPVVPPLALLLAAQLAHLQSKHPRAKRYAATAAIVAGLFTGGYAVAKVVPAFRQHRAAFAVFGREVRGEVAVRHLRFDVVGGEDEGMLVYLRKTEFAELPDAIAHWRAGAVNAIVAPEEAFADLTGALPDVDAARTRLSGAAGNHHRRYVFLTRR